MINKKRGQITVFIIIAVILLFSSAIYFYYSNYTATSQIEPTTAITTNVPQSIKPISGFVDNCLEKTADDAIVLAGQQGGHIYLDSFQKPIENSVLGDMLETFPGGGQYVPYWYYSKDGLGTTANIPQLNKVTRGDNSIQDQVEKYIRENIDSCIDGFRKFSSQGFKITEKKLQSGERFDPQVMFTEDEVVTSLQYPLDIEKGDVNEQLSDFRVETNKKVKKMYELANNIVKIEKNDTFLEYNTLISMLPYQMLNKDYLPPFIEPERFEECSEQKIWDMGDINDLMNNEVLQWLNLIRFNNTEGFKRIIADDANPEARNISQLYYDRFIVNLDKGYPEINAGEVVYPIRQLSINDRSIGPLFPTSSTHLDLFFFSTCVNKYEYYYNFDYPILFTLSDNTPNNEYAFQFPIQVEIKDNWPRISQQVIGSQMNITENASLDLLECDKSTFDSGEITLITKDKTDSSPIANANVYYQCGILGKKCYIGPTTSSGGVSKLESKFPKCLSGGVLVVEKPNYLSYLTLKNFEENTDEILTVNLTPIKVMDLDIKKYSTYKNEDGTCSFADTAPRTLGITAGLKDEKVILTITKLDYAAGLYNVYPAPYDSTSSTNKLKIAPGTYRMNMMLVKDYSPPFNVPCTIMNNKCIPEGGTDVETEISGGNNVTFTVTESDMTKNKIRFYVTSNGEPGSLYDINSGSSYVEACKAARPDLLSKVDFE